MHRGRASLLFSLVWFLGCGGRTGTLDFGAGASGPGNHAGSAGFGADGGGFNAGAPGFAGSPSVGGAPFAGGPSVGGGSFAGAPSFAGSPSFGGAPFAGGPSFGGAPSFAGSPSFGGAPFAGGPSFGGFSGGGVIIDACVAISPSACEKCLCTSCPSQVVGCFSDAHCIAVFACVVRTGCQGIGCYVNGPCKKVIDDNGGVQGAAVREVFSLASCAVQSQNNCACN